MSPTNPTYLSFVIPVFNEERVIEATLATLVEFLEPLCASKPGGWQIMLVDDGSSDRSAALVEAFIAAHPGLNIRLERLPQNLGKGAAVRRGMLRADGEYIFFLDADLSTPLDQTASFLGALETGCDVAIGNRRVPGSQITRRQPRLRQTLGRGFTLMVNLLLAPGVHDFTCGFKGFRKDAARRVFERSSLNGWAFDAELVVIAQVQHLKLAQLPVSWHHEDDTKVRLLAAVFGSLVEVAQITRHRMRGKYD